MKRLITLVLGLALTVPTLSAVGFTFDSTGTNTVPGPPVTDTFWSIISGPGIGSPIAARKATANPIQWFANDSSSSWIAPVSDPGFTFSAAGTYVYRATFTIPSGFSASTASMTFRIASDDVLSTVLVNGNSYAGNLFTPSGFTAWGSNGGANATLTGGTGFVVGLNTLDFSVTNSALGPTGFRLEILGTNMNASATGVPEPSTMFLAGAGLFAVAFLRRKK
jgi:hypothetical protein